MRVCIVTAILSAIMLRMAYSQSGSSTFMGPIEVQRSFDFEDALDDLQQDMWVWRSEASNMKTLRLVDSDQTYTVTFNVCIEPLNQNLNASLVIDDIRYSNDGPFDTVLIRFNGVYYAYFYTVEKWRSGHEWNVFRNTGRLGNPISLPQGQYNLSVSVVTDSYGVELDRIRLNAENQNPIYDLFCGAVVTGGSTSGSSGGTSGGSTGGSTEGSSGGSTDGTMA